MHLAMQWFDGLAGGMHTIVSLSLGIKPRAEAALLVILRWSFALALEVVFNSYNPDAVLGAGKE